MNRYRVIRVDDNTGAVTTVRTHPRQWIAETHAWILDACNVLFRPVTHTSRHYGVMDQYGIPVDDTLPRR
jgi:hypothetical protein